jgi:amidase
MTYGHSWDGTKVDNVSLGLARDCARQTHRLPGAIRRLRRSAVRSAEFYQDWDVTLTPTMGTATPRLGHLDPAQDWETVHDRLLEWVAFTPYHNATGDPAISLPLASSADGLPLGMMLAAGAGREATLLELAYELEAARPWPRIQDV